jgi:hypothetical protein
MAAEIEKADEFPWKWSRNLVPLRFLVKRDWRDRLIAIAESEIL